MENEKGESSSIFKMGNSGQERSLPYVPDCYAVPPSYEPRDALDSNFEIVPTIDISRLKGSDDERRGVIQELSSACQLFGFFQVRYIFSYNICKVVEFWVFCPETNCHKQIIILWKYLGQIFSCCFIRYIPPSGCWLTKILKPRHIVSSLIVGRNIYSLSHCKNKYQLSYAGANPV